MANFSTISNKFDVSCTKCNSNYYINILIINILYLTPSKYIHKWSQDSAKVPAATKAVAAHTTTTERVAISHPSSQSFPSPCLTSKGKQEHLNPLTRDFLIRLRLMIVRIGD